MASWGYVAIDKTGKEIRGSRDADTQAGTHRFGSETAEYIDKRYQHQLRQKAVSQRPRRILPAVCRYRACRCQHHRSSEYVGRADGEQAFTEIPHGGSCRCGKG